MDDKSNVSIYGAIGQEYTVPINCPLEEIPSGTSSASSTVASTSIESDVESSLPFAMSSEDTKLLFPTKAAPSTLSDYFFHFLGFEANPLRFSPTAASDRTPDAVVRNSAAADLRLSMLSNFSTAYNIISVSLSLRIMDNTHESLTPADASLCSSALIAGMIVGQLAGGTLGDVLGRHRAMAAFMFLQIIASAGSACSVEVAPYASIFQVLAGWRFVLGVACGGVYPLAATLTAETALSPQNRAKAVAFTFSFQGVGYVFVPAISWILLTMLSEDSDLAWRILLGAGAVPGAILTAVRFHNARQYLKRRRSFTKDVSPLVDSERQQNSSNRLVPVSVWSAIALEKDLVRKFLGTGGCWFIFDVLFYGNTLFQPVVLSKAFGVAETVQRAARDTLVIALLSLPGYFVSVYAVGRQSPRFIQLQGFFAMGILYLCIGVLFKVLSESRAALLLVYSASFFFSNYGPNATTFLLPCMTFSRACRSTLNGISAASGKIGALLGATIFVTASSRFGQVPVFLSCAVLSFVGGLLTLLCVSSNVGLRRDDCDEEESVSMAAADKEMGFVSDTLSANLPMKVVYSQPSLIDFVQD